MESLSLAKTAAELGIPDPMTFTPEDARKVLEDEQRRKLEEFQTKLNALCQEYNVTLQVQQNIVAVFNAA